MNDALIARFLAYLRTERGATELTIESYTIDLAKFAEWFRGSLVNVKRTDLQRYVSDVLTVGKSGRTAARYLACLRCFYRFLIDESEIMHDPTRNLPVPKSWKTVPKSVTEGDLSAMVKSLGSSLLELRDIAMLLTFFGSGLRVTELTNLKLQDVNLDAGVLKVWNGKGGKDGVLPLSPRATEALRGYLSMARPRFCSDDSATSHLFVGRSGNQLTRQQIHNRVRNIASVALGKRVSSHSLRHGYATALVEGGADIRDVQALMRHSSVDTTQIYIHHDLNFLRRAYYASHPRANAVAV